LTSILLDVCPHKNLPALESKNSNTIVNIFPKNKVPNRTRLRANNKDFSPEPVGLCQCQQIYKSIFPNVATLKWNAIFANFLFPRASSMNIMLFVHIILTTISFSHHLIYLRHQYRNHFEIPIILQFLCSLQMVAIQMCLFKVFPNQ
jgi:hypothetical protein